MIFLPIVDRELRVAARRHNTYSTRLVVALAGIGVCVFFYSLNLGASTRLLGRYTFQGLSSLALGYCLFAGRRWTADCLTEEKREGTLGLLFLTDLKGYDVVFGKLAATSLNGFYGLFAIFPVLALPLLLGGVTNGEFWRMVLVLVNSFLFSLATGVCASALSRVSRQAMAMNLLLLLFLGASLPACAGVIAYFSSSHRIIHELLVPCPVYSCYLAFDANYPWHKWNFWWSIAVIHAFTWVLVALASWVAPRSWRDQSSTGDTTRRWRNRWHDWLYGDAQKRKAFRTRLLNVNPFFWLAARVHSKPAGAWAFLGFMACWWLGMCLALGFHWTDESLSLTTGLMLGSVLKLWIAIEAGQRLAEDRKIGALELLLSTPLRVSEILRGQILALRRQFLKPCLLAILAIWILFVVVGPESFQEKERLHAFGIAGIFMFVIDVLALVGMAMAAALTVRNPNHTSIKTIFRVLILPWIAFVAIAIVVATDSGSDRPGWRFYLGLWFMLGILADLGFGIPAWNQLRTRFRVLALQSLSAQGSSSLIPIPSRPNHPR